MSALAPVALGRGVARLVFAVLGALAASVLSLGLGGRAQRAFWRRMRGRVDWRILQHHFISRAVVGFDRCLFALGVSRGFSVVAHGEEALQDLRARGQGGLLLGAHLGTLACLRALPDAPPLTVVVNLAKVDRLNRLLARLDPAPRPWRVLGANGGLDTVMAAKEAVSRGELVAILADRGAGDPKGLGVDFLGDRLRLPAAPFVLAAVLKCPVLLGFGLHRGQHEGHARYDFFCEPFADKVVLPPGGREAALAALAQRYADRVAHHVALQPDNWFNFITGRE